MCQVFQPIYAPWEKHQHVQRFLGEHVQPLSAHFERLQDHQEHTLERFADISHSGAFLRRTSGDVDGKSD
jgi:hypothetical protein